MVKQGRPRGQGSLPCARCERLVGKYRANWPDGRICGPCFTTATTTNGTCPQCNAHRLLPGRNSHGENICRHCAGITSPLECITCGQEDECVRGGQCARCVVRHDLTQLMGNPQPESPAATLLDALVSVPRPASITTWMRNPNVQHILTGLGNSSITFTHESFDALPQQAASRHIRALCVDNNLLPLRDESYSRFVTWIDQVLINVGNSLDRKILEQFITWHHLKRITQFRNEGTSTHSATHSAKQEITNSIGFLNYLRERKTSLSTCTQLDIAHWLATGTTTRHHVRTFIIWAKAAGHCPTKVHIGHRAARTTPLMSDNERITLLQKTLHGDDPVRTRAAAMLVLLYGQPITRIAALERNCITSNNGVPAITFTTEAVDILEPFATLMNEYLTTGAMTGTRTQRSPWLFPGRTSATAGDRTSLRNELARFGIDLRGGRNAALRQLVRNAPAPVVAHLIGYSHNVINAHAGAAQTTNARYAAIKGRSSTTNMP